MAPATEHGLGGPFLYIAAQRERHREIDGVALAEPVGLNGREPWFLTGVVASRSSSVNSLSAAGLAGLSQAIITSAAKTKYVIRIYIINKYRNKVTQ